MINSFRKNVLQNRIDTTCLFGCWLVLFLAPNQYSFRICGAHLSLVDPLVWITAFGCLCWQVAVLQKTGISFRKLLHLLPFDSVLFMVLVSLSVCKSSNLFRSGKEIFQLCEYSILVFFIFYHCVNTEDRLRIANNIILLTSSIIITLGFLQYLNTTVSVQKVCSLFGNRNIYSGFVALVLPLFLSNVIFEKRKLLKVLLSCVVVAGLVSSLAGGAFMACVISLFVVCLLISRKAVLGVAVMFLLLCLALPLFPRSNIDILHDSIRLYDYEMQQIASRYSEWEASFRMWREEPLLGVGIGDYQTRIGEYYGFLPMAEGGKEADHNNLFLVFLSSVGIVGLLGLVYLLVAWGQLLLALLVKKPGQYARIVALAASGALVAFSVASIWSALLVRGVFIVLVILVAMPMNIQKPVKTKKRN